MENHAMQPLGSEVHAGAGRTRVRREKHLISGDSTTWDSKSTCEKNKFFGIRERAQNSTVRSEGKQFTAQVKRPAAL